MDTNCWSKGCTFLYDDDEYGVEVEDLTVDLMSKLRITNVGTDTSSGDSLATKNDEKMLSCRFLDLPTEIRAKIYSYLQPEDFCTLRSACRSLYWETNDFGCFNVFLKRRPYPQLYEVPFSKLLFLFIDNDYEDLNWGDCIGDTVHTLILRSVTYKTLKILGSSSLKIKQITLKPNLFTRPFPPLNWNHLNFFCLQFHVPMDKDEYCMLDNLDTLFDQDFPSLKTLVVGFSNERNPNIQSRYAVRVARFVAKHFKSLQQLSLSMEARRCVQHNYVTPPNSKPALLETDFLNFKKVQLTSLELNLSEITCPKCNIWRTLIQCQNNLKALHVHASYAEKLPTMFFCNLEKLDQFLRLEFLTLRFWGLGDFYPLDFRYLQCARKLTSLEIGRYSEARMQFSQPEILNINKIPQNIHIFSLSGFLISRQDVPVLLSNLPCVTSFTLLQSGSSPQESLGVTSEHIPNLASHPKILFGLIDFNAEDLQLCSSSALRIENAFESYDGFPYFYKHLYDVGFNQYHHRFEFNRIPDSGFEENTTYLHNYIENHSGMGMFGKFYSPYETLI